MKILIATDGSPYSQSAVNKAAEILTNNAETEVRILSVYEKLGPMVGDPFGASIQYYMEAENAARKIAEDAIAMAVATLRSKFDDIKFSISTDVERGRVAQMIVDVAEEWGADTIILGSHGYGFWERNLLGSVSSSVVHHAPCSVFVVRLTMP